MKIERIECPRFFEAMDAQREAEQKRKENTAPDLRTFFNRETQKYELLARSYESWFTRMAKGVLAAMGKPSDADGLGEGREDLGDDGQ